MQVLELLTAGNSCASLGLHVNGLEKRQATLLTAAGAVEPLDLHSVDLARSSIRLFEATHELDEASRANIKGCALSAVGE